MFFGILLTAIGVGVITALTIYFAFIAILKFLKNIGFDKED